jgi:hypothetical protein
MPLPATANVSRNLLAAVVLAAVVVVGFATDVNAQASTYVTWRDARVSIAATDAPVNAILRELALRTGSKIVGLEQATERVTVDIRDAHVLDALRMLLADVRANYLYILRSAPTTSAPDRVTLWLYGPSSRPASIRAFRAEIREVEPASVEPQGYLAALPPLPAEDEVMRLSRAGAFGAGATQASLLALAKSPDPEVRMVALQSIALQSNPVALEALKAALKDESPFVRAQAMDLMISQGPGLVQQLGSLAEHEDAEVRGAAVLALGEHEGEDAEFLLQRASKDGDSAVRGFAARALQQKQATEKPKR